MRHRRWFDGRYAAELAAVALVYFCVARFGFLFAFGTKQVTAVWPVTGVALVSILLIGYRIWPAILLGAFAVNATRDEPIGAAAGIAFGNTLGPMLAALLLRRVAKLDHALARVRDVVALILFGALVGMIVPATNGVANLALAHIVPWSDFASVWWVWWVGDAMGVLLIAPFLLTWVAEPRFQWKRWRAVEFVALFSMLSLVSYFVFVTANEQHFAYSVFPFIIWAALRFGQRETASVVVLLAGVAVWGTVHQQGPFAARTLDEGLVQLEAFMAVASVAALVLGATTAERRRAEESLWRQAQLLQLSDDAILQRHPDGRIESWNRGAERLYGFTAEEACGRISHALLRTTFPQPLDEIEAKMRKERTWEGELIHTTKDGRPVTVSAKFQWIVGEDGVERVFETNRDITEKKRLAAEALQLAAESLSIKQSEHRFRTLAEAMPQMVWSATPDGQNTYFNQRWVEYTGLTLEESYGQGWSVAFHPDDRPRAWEAWRRAQQTHGVYSAECRLRDAYGNYRWWLIRGLPVHDPSGEVISWFGTCTDVDDIKRLEEALRRAVATRDEVLGVVAHDLRNPLATILLQTAALARKGPEPERRNQRPREVIVRAASRMNRLIQDLLDVAQMEAGGLHVGRSQLSARDLVIEAADAQRSLAAAQGLELEVDLQQELPEVWGDRDRLLQVFENLIGNAIKFSKPGGRVAVGVATRRPDLVFWVSDTGPGISPESLPHVFDRFWQATEHAGRFGAGLGLAITKGIVEAHGGRIWAESTPGQGATFFFTIPAGRPAEERAPEVLH